MYTHVHTEYWLQKIYVVVAYTVIISRIPVSSHKPIVVPVFFLSNVEVSERKILQYYTSNSGNAK